MGPAKSRKAGIGKGRNASKFTPADFQNPPDSSWSAAKLSKFEELRAIWRTENPDWDKSRTAEEPSSHAEGIYASNASSPDITNSQAVDPREQPFETENGTTLTIPIRPAADDAPTNDTTVGDAATDNGQTPDASAQGANGGKTNTSGATIGAGTSGSFYTVQSLETNPTQEAPPAKKKIKGDLDVSKIDTFISNSHRDFIRPPPAYPGSTATFSANHFELRIINGPELAHIYPVTIINEQRPQNMRKLTPSTQGSNSSQGYPNVPAKKRRRIFELLLQALQAAVPNFNTRRATNYKTQVITVDHELIVQQDSQAVRAPFVVTIQYYDSNQAGPSNNPWIYQVAVSSAKRLEIGRLRRTLAGTMNAAEIAFTQRQIEQMKPEYLDLFNMLTTQIPMEKCIATTETSPQGMALAGASKFYPYTPSAHGLTQSPDLRIGLNALYGFYRSVRLLNSRPQLQLNVNTSTSAFYRWENLQNVINSKIVGDFQNGRGALDIASITAHNWQELDRFVRGVQVRARYNNVDNIYTISGLAMTEPEIIWDEAQQKKVQRYRAWPWNEQRAPTAQNVSFLMDQRDAQGQSVVDAHGITLKQQPPIQLLRHYNQTLRVPQVSANHLVVRTGGGERVLYFPANLLTVLPGQHYKGQIAISVGAKSPMTNRNEILGNGKITYSLDTAHVGDVRNRFGLNLGSRGDLLEVQGERLSIRELQYRSKRVQGQARWDLRDAKCYAPPVIASAAQNTGDSAWSFLELTIGNLATDDRQNRNLSSNRLNEYVAGFTHALASFGIDLPASIDHSRDYGGHKIALNRNTWVNLRHEMSRWPQVKLWVILLPEKKTDWYSQIKTIGDLEVGVSTVCHVKRTFTSKPQLDQLCSNICLKANLKLSRSSVNHVLAQRSTLLADGTMVVGIDVTHAPGGARKNSPSVAAVVASIDKNYAQWPASIKLNARDEEDTKEALEEVQELKQMMVERLACYHRYNTKYPERIVVYRDGLSEGQFEMAKTREFGRIMAAVEQVYGSDNHPDIMLICAVKRHHTRFLPTANARGAFPASRNSNSPYQGDLNPAVGTVFYDTVTYGNGLDFFLVSQVAMPNATVRPAHYVVLVNTCANTTIKDVANMTMDLCALFGRATVSVGLATPAYYADLACGRAAKYIAPYTKPDPQHPNLPFDYSRASQIRLMPRDSPNNPGEHFGDCMFYL